MNARWLKFQAVDLPFVQFRVKKAEFYHVNCIAHLPFSFVSLLKRSIYRLLGHTTDVIIFKVAQLP